MLDLSIKAIRLLTALGYAVEMPQHAQSGRAQLSKGLLLEARELARRNVRILSDRMKDGTVLLGLEPSAILSFRDEYPRLVAPGDVEAARSLAGQTLLFDEFMARETERGRIGPDQFTPEPARVLLHAHCHQKALSSAEVSAQALSLPSNYLVEVIPSGCCGMAGSFGYEAEHYDISMRIGELVLFPAVNKAATGTVIAATGTSCRHQIQDGTGRKALHPAEILWEAMLK